MPLALLALLASCAATPPPPPVPVSLPEPVTVSPEAEPVREPGPVAAPAAAPDPVSGQTGIAAEAKPPSLDFEVAAAPAVLLPPGIGAPVVSAASRLSVGSRDALAASFRDAYLEALFRGERLLGVYGGDKAHEWKVGAVASWVQNWRGAEARENSWGLKGLALAIKADGRERTVVLSGNLLDAFGRGAGRGGANGIAGYGPPLTDVYPSGDGIAVRFEFGLMEIEADGTRRFTMADPPSVFLDVPEAVGAGPEMSAARRAAFRAGWLAAVDSGFPAAMRSWSSPRNLRRLPNLRTLQPSLFRASSSRLIRAGHGPSRFP